jgi:transglutaminase-like putative cysteine protease
MKHASPPLPPTLKARLLGVLSLVLLPHALHLAPWISLLAALGLLWHAFHLRSGAPLPHRAILAALLLAGTAVVWLTHGGIFGRDGGVSFLVLLTVLKLLESRTRRDGGLLGLLGLFLLLTLFLFDQGPLTALWALGAFALLLGLLGDLASPLEPLPLHRRLRGLAPTLGLALPIALLLFVFVPRPAAPLFGLPQADRAVTGLSDSLAPGTITDLSRSEAVAFRATFAGAEPARDQLYWRGPVFWHYDGRRWARLPDLPRPKALTMEPGEGLLEYSLMLEPQGSAILPALDIPVEAPEGTRLLLDHDLRFNRPQETRRLLTLRAAPHARLDPDLPEGLRRQALQLPEGENPLLHDLGTGWQKLEPRERIEAALRLFRAQGFRYTLRPPPLPEQDGMDAFLFDTRAGFCEHYASAFVLLMRAAGLPARVVTGYQGGERHPDGYWLVRQGDAHAWAEVWIEGEGWLRVDPTEAIAPQRIESGLAAAVPETVGELPAALRRDFGFLHRARLRLDGVENRWNRWVLGFDRADQRALLDRLGWKGDLRLGLWGALGIGLGLLAIMALAASRWRRPRMAPAQRLWARFERALGTIGVSRQPGEGPRALARRIAREQPELAQACAGFIEAYLHWRHAPAGVAQAAVEQALRSAERAIRATTPVQK